MNEENFFEIEARSIYAEGFAIVVKVMRDKDISPARKAFTRISRLLLASPPAHGLT